MNYYSFLFLLVGCLSFPPALGQSQIIFDTDFGGDADDLGALAMLHHFIDQGECDLLAVMCWSTEKYSPAAVDAVNRYYHHPNIPIGIRTGESHHEVWNHSKVIADRFSHEISREKAEEATSLYRKILARAADHSIKIVTVGPLMNIQKLLQSGPDGHSGWTGKELIRNKVQEFVIMGGQFPSGKKEWNFDGDMKGGNEWLSGGAGNHSYLKLKKDPEEMARLIESIMLHQEKRTPVILDADTGNEVDDLYAIVRALIEPSWHITALNATHWQTSHWAEPQSMENSHRINQVLLGELGLNVKTRRGGTARMYDWGDKAQHSAAAYEIIRQAQAMPEGEKLTVIALGALTNVASAIYIEPSIESRVKLYWLGTNYDFEKGIMGTTDFNCIMDIQALHIMLQSEVEMHVVPHSVAIGMRFTLAETEAQLRGVHQLGDVLCDRWYNHLDGLRKHRWIWDLALIEAMLHPEWTERTTITTSKDLGSRPIHYYSAIDGAKMKADFFSAVRAYLENLH
jgi:purine nucleosidase